MRRSRAGVPLAARLLTVTGHTASTAAGNNGVDAVINGGSVGSMSGMAPQAQLRCTRACGRLRTGGPLPTADLVHAIDDAVADGVDVINYSISGSSTYVVSPDEIAFLNAADAGVFVSTSAGNLVTRSARAAWRTTRRGR